ncbi:MAG TPA: helix-turn-helix domain-containing protein [Acidimicrobiia bacterium]|jgi:predicted ArsR family transcriptional regulator
MPGPEPLEEEEVDAQIRAVAALNEPVRRGLYRLAVSRPAPLSRDEAARELGISRELAAFHLDKLVELGMLEVEFRRLSGRQGPGAGRPAKLYRPSALQLELSFPPRRYDLAAHLLAEAMDGEGGATAGGLDGAARRFGEELGREVRRHLGRRPGVDELLAEVVTVLDRYGFEAVRRDGEVVLRNCPFAAVAAAHPEVVCGMNLAIVDGLVAGLRTGAIRGRLAPEPGRCCVVVAPEPT